MLEHQRALQVAGAVKAGREFEVPFEQRFRVPEPLEHLARLHRTASILTRADALPVGRHHYSERGGQYPGRARVGRLGGRARRRRFRQHRRDGAHRSGDGRPRVETHPWAGYAAQKNHATALAAHDWVLSLDADERVTPALADEICAVLASAPPAHGYRIPRVTRYLGRWIRSTDWYPDPQLRLYDRRHAHWADVLVHESVVLEGSPGRLHGELEHHPYRDIAHHLRTIDRYTSLAAEQMRKNGRRAGVSDLALQAPAAFLRNYLLRGGVRDGAAGLLVSILNSYYVFLKFAKLWNCSSGGRIDAGGGSRGADGRIGMRTLKLTLSYDGTDFVGWQRQEVGRSIQGENRARAG